jgi:hypothetical protein
MTTIVVLVLCVCVCVRVCVCVCVCICVVLWMFVCKIVRHFTIRGAKGTDFEGGIYHGRILVRNQ